MIFTTSPWRRPRNFAIGSDTRILGSWDSFMRYFFRSCYARTAKYLLLFERNRDVLRHQLVLGDIVNEVVSVQQLYREALYFI